MRVGLLLGLLALPLLWAACSGEVASGGPVQGDAGSAGVGADNGALAGSAGARETDCSKLPLEACASGVNCHVLEATIVYPVCSKTEEAVGCARFGCNSSATRAADPQGREWVFPDDCLPAGWTELPFSTECGEGGALN